MQQHGGRAICSRVLRSSVAANAYALLAAANPKPSVFLAQHASVFIEQREMDGLVGRRTQEERSIRLDPRPAHHDRLAGSVQRLQLHGFGSNRKITSARLPYIQGQ